LGISQGEVTVCHFLFKGIVYSLKLRKSILSSPTQQRVCSRQWWSVANKQVKLWAAWNNICWGQSERCALWHRPRQRSEGMPAHASDF